MLLSWIYAICGLSSLLYTLNAHFPRPPGHLFSVPSFFAGWLTSELPLHHLLGLALLAALALASGAFAFWPASLGLLASLASGMGLFSLLTTARNSEGLIERALQDGLGTSYRDGWTARAHARIAVPQPRRRLIPFRLDDRRVERIADIDYAAPPGNQASDTLGSLFLRSHPKSRGRLDLYRRRGAPLHRAPVLLWIHGGGWVIGHKQQQAQPFLKRMAAAGWICAAANYSLGPRARLPQPLVDLKRALVWLQRHVEQYGGDPEFIVVSGGSAGAHLASLLALSAGDPSLQPGFEHADTRVAACVPFYGIYDLTNHDGTRPHPVYGGYLRRVVMPEGFFEDPEAYRQASPYHRVHPEAPPFCIVHGSHDSLAQVADARRFGARLREVSHAPVVSIELPQAQHAFEVFHSPRSDRVLAGVQRFLASIRSAWVLRRGPRRGPMLLGSPEGSQ